MSPVKRHRPTVREIRGLKREKAELAAAIEHWKQLFALQERVRVRYHAVLLAAVVAGKDPAGPLWLDETDHAVVSGAPAALAGAPGTFCMDGGSLGRGSGNMFFRLDVGGHSFMARRR